MVSRRERVMRALNFESTGQAPLDLGGMNSTGISCFAYGPLVAHLGLPPRRPRVHDTHQMLALPDTDVLDALDCDVAALFPDVTNAYEQDDLWRPYDFGGRLDALVRRPGDFETAADGAILQGPARMPRGSYVFEVEHAGQPILLEGEIPRPDLAEMRRHLEASRYTDETVERIAAHARRARASTSRALLFNGPPAGIGIAAHTGIAMFPMLCLTEPGYVHDLHGMIVEHQCRQAAVLLEAMGDCVDIYMTSADDWGTQSSTVAGPEVYRELFLPYYQQFNGAIHRAAPHVKRFLHSCGAVFDLLELFIESGFDVLNPVQWTAGGRGYAEWKAAAAGRLALWGGGADAQHTLPLAAEDVMAREVAAITACMKQGGGYVFNSIHNILAEIPPEKVAAMYRTAARA